MRTKFLLLLMTGLIISCADPDKNPLVESVPEISKINIDSTWNKNDTSGYFVEAAISDPQGPTDISSVTFHVENDAGLTVYTGILLDDGSYNSSSTDVIAGDGVYRNLFKVTDISIQIGTYTFSFFAQDKEGNEAEMKTATIVLDSDYIPKILSVEAPSILASGSAKQSITAKVSDADSIADVENVFLDLIQNGLPVLAHPMSLYNDGNTTLNGDQFAGDSIFSILIDSTFAASRQGDYTLLFTAMDAFGATSAQVSRVITLENTAGQILELRVPTSVQRPTSGTIQLFLTARVTDPQGLGDMDSVYFYSRKPDGTLANSGAPFVLVDNGKAFNINNPFVEAGDKVAGDGTYSLTVIIDNTAQTGTFKFTFYMRDKVGNLTPGVVKTIEVN